MIRIPDGSSQAVRTGVRREGSLDDIGDGLSREARANARPYWKIDPQVLPQSTCGSGVAVSTVTSPS